MWGNWCNFPGFYLVVLDNYAQRKKTFTHGRKFLLNTKEDITYQENKCAVFKYYWLSLVYLDYIVIYITYVDNTKYSARSAK